MMARKVSASGPKYGTFATFFPRATIGRRLRYRPGLFDRRAGCVLGNGVKLQNGVSVFDGVVLEDGVFCGPHMVFTNVLNPRAFIEKKQEFRITRVGKGATIGAGAVIVCGNTIGEYAMVGAGAVVTRDVPAFALVYGNPARQNGWVDRAGNRLPPTLSVNKVAIGHDGARYSLHDGVLRLEDAA